MAVDESSFPKGLSNGMRVNAVLKREPAGSSPAEIIAAGARVIGVTRQSGSTRDLRTVSIILDIPVDTALSIQSARSMGTVTVEPLWE